MTGIQDETKTVDEIIDEIGKSPSFLMIIIAFCVMSCAFAGTIFTYMVVFTGFIPEQEYSCLSQKCLDVRENYITDSGKINSTFYKTKTICENNMIHDVDFKWNLTRTSFAVDFDKICKKSEISLLNSLFFAGGTFSLFVGTMTFELLGRRKSSALGGIICTAGTLVGYFCNSYELMIAVRVLQGSGNFLLYTGSFIWWLEFIPEDYRLYCSIGSAMTWVLGYPITVCICYFIHDWHEIFLASTIAVAFTVIPILILPDSPRYLLSIGKVEKAKKVLVLYSKLGKKPVDLEEVVLVAGESEQDGESTKTRISEIKKHKALLLETSIMWYIWFACSLLFYFLNYGWDNFGDTPYVNYLFAGLGEGIANISLIPIVKVLGRKNGMRFSLIGACLCFLLGIIPWQWTDVWNFERLVSLIAIVAVTWSFSTAYLYTAELAPTSHRGLVLSSCNIMARCAAFIGPFVSDIFKSNILKLGVNAALAGSAMLLVFLLPETRKLPIPEQAKDVTLRREKQGLVVACR